MEKFTINISVSIQPESARTQIEQAFDQSYKGDRGTDETPGEFLERKLEEYALQIFKAAAINQAMQTANQQAAEEINTAATIKQRKNKPPVMEPQPEPIA